MEKTQQTNSKNVEDLEKKILILQDQLKETNETLSLLSKNLVQLAASIKEKTLVQQSICEQVVILSEAVANLQKANYPESVLKYDMPNEPYN